MAKESKGTSNPFLNANAPHMQAPENVDRASLEKQEAAAAPKVSASVQEAMKANPKNAPTREILHPDFKRLGIAVFAVNFVEHKARVRDADAIDWLRDNMPEATLVKDALKGGRLFTYDPVLLNKLVAAAPKAVRKASGSSVKYLIDTIAQGKKSAEYIAYDSVEFDKESMTRKYNGVHLYATYNADLQSGSVTVYRDGHSLTFDMTIDKAINFAPDRFEMKGGKWVAKPSKRQITQGVEAKLSPDRLYFICRFNVTNTDGSISECVIGTMGQTNTLDGVLHNLSRISFPSLTAVTE